MQVSIPQSLIAKFRRKALRVFPSEFFAYFVGKRKSETHIDIHDLYIPDLQIADQFSVATTSESLTQAMEYAAAKKMIVVGDVHTHCYPYATCKGTHYEAVPSIGDSQSWESHILIGGVYNLVEDKKGRKHGQLAIWEPTKMCDIESK